VSNPVNSQPASIAAGSKLSNVVTVDTGFVFGIICPDHNATKVYIRVGETVQESDMKRLFRVDGSEAWYIVTSGSACAAPIEGLSPFCYAQVETDLSQVANVTFKIVSKKWERSS